MAKKIVEETSPIVANPSLWAGPDVPFIPWGKGCLQLASYIDLMLKWNRVLNLSGCSSAITFMQDLAQDSFHLAKALDRLHLPDNHSIVDLGAGAGLPGIPLRIFREQGAYTFVDRSQKRCAFLANALGQLNLQNVHISQGDAETVLRSMQRTPDIILSRAFMPWKSLLNLCANNLAPAGKLILMLNEPLCDSLPPGWKIYSHMEYHLPKKSRVLAVLEPNANLQS